MKLKLKFLKLETIETEINSKKEKKMARHQVARISFLVSLILMFTGKSGNLTIRRRSKDTTANEINCIVSKNAVSNAFKLHKRFCAVVLNVSNPLFSINSKLDTNNGMLINDFKKSTKIIFVIK